MIEIFEITDVFLSGPHHSKTRVRPRGPGGAPAGAVTHNQRPADPTSQALQARVHQGAEPAVSGVLYRPASSTRRGEDAHLRPVQEAGGGRSHQHRHAAPDCSCQARGVLHPVQEPGGAVPEPWRPALRSSALPRHPLRRPLPV